MLDDLEKVIAGLKYWNLILDPVNSYENRFLLQKLTFLSQSLGMKLSYNFGLYVAGPYCSQLADDYYKHSNRITSLQTDYRTTKKENEIFMKIKRYVIDRQVNEKRMSFIEGVATIQKLYLDGHATTEEELHYKTKEIKPHLSDYIIIIALNAVKQLNFKSEYLTDELKEEFDLWDRID